MSQSAALEEARALFQQVGLPERLFSASASVLSADIHWRLQLALILARQPALVLTDEPTLGLERASKAELLALLKGFSVTGQAAVLLNTHDLGMVAELADEVTVLHAGRVVEQGPVSAVLTQPQHPYTVRLLQSPPEPDQRHSRLRVLPDPVLTPLTNSVGCPFAPRCARDAAVPGAGALTEGRRGRLPCPLLAVLRRCVRTAEDDDLQGGARDARSALTGGRYLNDLRTTISHSSITPRAA